MRSLTYILFGILILFSLTCNENTNESRQRSSSGIQGTVLDDGGNSVNDVGVHVVFNGFPLPGESVSKVSQTDSVHITAMTARSSSEGVQIRWTTDYEYNVAGFHIWRSEEENAGYQMLSTSIIPGQGNSITTNEYTYLDLSVESGIDYWYQIEVIFSGGSFTFYGPFNITSVVEEIVVPIYFQLFQNYPNPFNPTTSICYSLAKQSQVNLKIYDRKGILIRNLINQVQVTGKHMVQWDVKDEDGQSCTDGLYRYVFQADTFQAQKVMCIRQRIPEVLEGCVPLTTTDEDGSFMVDDAYLPVGEEVIHTSEVGDSLGVLTISESFSVVLTKEGYVSVVDTVQFVPGQLISKSYVMTKN
jgi:hypothetical protein